MEEVHSNHSPTRAEYVELRLMIACDAWCVDALVFSRDPAWVPLVDIFKMFSSRDEAVAYLRSHAAQHGLRLDPGMAHRRRIWSV